ncbi:MAG: SUMF1/EgtB/PvdO family nonheme iron enzyme [Rhizobiaceae bacterium]
MAVNYLLSASAAAAMLLTPLAAISFAGGTIPDRAASASGTVIEMVELAAGAVIYPLPGEFLIDGRPAAAPVAGHEIPHAIAIMKYQVSYAGYQRCVDAGACKPADAPPAAEPEMAPVTGVNYLDAQAYAAWFSRETGGDWRLPTAAEWAYAAAERFTGESYSAVASDPDNPAVAWIRRYEEEAAARRKPDAKAHPRGHFGPNTNGIEDLAGNIWEWTSTCYMRTTFDGVSGAVVHETENCGVRVAEGRHRSYMSDFIRDGVSGGCAVGTPPDNLGFRLVRDTRRSVPERLMDLLRGTIFRDRIF